MFYQFPHYKQHDVMDCGPTCLRIISRFYGKYFSLEYLRDECNTNRMGSTFHGLRIAAEKVGYIAEGIKISIEDLFSEPLFPCIAYWQQKHFIVIYRITKKKVYVSDPALGLITYKKNEFLKHWAGGDDTGILLVLEPTEVFHLNQNNTAKSAKTDLNFAFKYIKKYRQLVFQLLIGLFIATALQLVFPFINQSIIDVGVQKSSIDFIYLMLVCQLILFAGRTSVELIRGHILVHLSSRINLNLLSEFFYKLTRLPLSFFDVKVTGDILQRILDHQRVENFLTSSALTIIFTLFNFLIFGGVLLYYNSIIFVVFLIGSIIHFSWITIFMKKRAIIDYKRFTQLSTNQDKNLELIYGMQEIKLHNAERNKTMQWEDLQVDLFKINLKSLSLKQYQSAGSSVINELKNILITFFAAQLVIKGEISLGMMLSIAFINGQLNGSVSQFVDFMQNYQDAKLSMERINEIHNKDDEDLSSENTVYEFPDQADIVFSNVSFRYDILSSPEKSVLRNLDFTIPRNKVTAIVGASGSGKTTLLKLLLKFYEPNEGSVSIGNIDLQHVSNSFWRDKCGSVMQEGYIFSDTIKNNIVVSDESIDYQRLNLAVDVANIGEYIYNLPLKFETILGANGTGLSTGQKQRLLIARAVYKNPEFLFFDEATSALDANNERKISDNLMKFYDGKTVLIIAHRLSTVRNADQILVLNNGAIIEVGNHNSLIERKGNYYNLVKNQLELGN